MVAFLYRMGAGVAGDVTRAEHALVQSSQIDASTPPTAFGSFVKRVNGKLRPLASGDAATVIKGLYVRNFPSGGAQDPIGTSTPPVKGMGDILRRGFMMVKLAQGSAVEDGQVYVRVTAASGKFVSDIETAADAGNCVAVADCFFVGPADANGIVEVEYKI